MGKNSKKFIKIRWAILGLGLHRHGVLQKRLDSESMNDNHDIDNEAAKQHLRLLYPEFTRTLHNVFEKKIFKIKFVRGFKIR